MNDKSNSTLDADRAARLLVEAQTLRYILRHLPPAEVSDAMGRYSEQALELVLTFRAAARQTRDGGRIELGDLAAILKRPELAEEAGSLAAYPEAASALDPTVAMDPQPLVLAAAKMLEDALKTGDLRRVESAEHLISSAKTAKTAAERRSLLDAASASLETAGRRTEASIDEVWTAYRKERYEHDVNGPQDALMLDKRRGLWASWVNAWTSRRGGLEPGRCVMIGARPNGGKTAMAAAIAVDAMAAGIPTLFCQLELSLGETIEHLKAQVPGMEGWWNEWETKRCDTAMPESWSTLLIIPRVDGREGYEAETIMEGMRRLRRQSDKLGSKHKCRGLVVVDYCQMLAVRAARDGRMPQHEILTSACSMLAKTAADLNLCLVLLTQLTKSAKTEQSKTGRPMEETAASGGDLSRCAHVFFGLSHASMDSRGRWQECGGRDVQKDPSETSEARLLARIKDRGKAKLNGAWPAYECQLWLSNERALHGGNCLTGKAKGGVTPGCKVELSL